MGGTLLVVDGDAALRALLTDALEEEGYRVWGCASVPQARSVLAHTIPDLLLLDIYQHAAAEGIALIDHVRLQRTTYDLPMVICSADQRLLKHEGTRLRTLGCGILPKPFDLETLFTMIAQLLSAPSRAEQTRAVGEL